MMDTSINELIHKIDNPYQKRSLDKLLLPLDKEKIYLVNYKEDNDADKNIIGSFCIMGSLNAKGKREKYDVKLYKFETNHKGSLWCSCPDHKFNSAKKNMVCKHICFLVCKVAKIFDKGFFDTKQLSSEQYDILLEKVNNIQALDQLSLEGSIYNPSSNSKISIFFEKRKDLSEDDICPICFNDMNDDNHNDILNCPQCKNYVHMECMNVWLETKNTCVYCRSDIWKIYNSK